MNSSELVTSSVLPAFSHDRKRGRERSAALGPGLAVAALTIVGAVLRVILAHQSLFADELSTYWISATHGLDGVLSLLYSSGRIHHAEITPPLSFLVSWLTTRLGHSPDLLRLPALIAGVASIPLVYMLGLRMVGRRAALVTCALTTFSPFMIYYSAEARAYGLMMFLVICSTLSLLSAIDTGRTRWWVLYALCSSAAFYTHYTCAFVLAAQLAWVLWAHPDARRPALLANLTAAALLVPWIPGLINDFNSPTLKILSALSPFSPYDVRVDLEHWAIGYPYTLAGSLRLLPGVVALILLGVSALLTAAGLLGRAWGRSLRAQLRDLDKRIVLVILLALAVPIGEALVSASGNHIFGVRNLAASWPYLALSVAAAMAAWGRVLGLVIATLAIVAFAIGAANTLTARFQRPAYQSAARFIAQRALPGDVVVDETGALSPGPLTGLDVALHRRLPIFRAQSPLERDHPFGFLDPVVRLPAAVKSAVSAANGHRVFVVTNLFTTNIAVLAKRVSAGPARFPPDYRLVSAQSWQGIGGTLVAEYADAGSRRR